MWKFSGDVDPSIFKANGTFELLGITPTWNPLMTLVLVWSSALFWVEKTFKKLRSFGVPGYLVGRKNVENVYSMVLGPSETMFCWKVTIIETFQSLQPSHGKAEKPPFFNVGKKLAVTGWSWLCSLYKGWNTTQPYGDYFHKPTSIMEGN